MPLPNEATNEQLDKLKPLYCISCCQMKNTCALSNNPQRKQLCTPVLAYPVFVEIARDDKEGSAKGHANERFPLVDFLEKIVSDDYICSWCRDTLNNSSSVHSAVFGSSMPILIYSLHIAGKEHTQKSIFRGEKNTAVALDSATRGS